MPIKMCKFKQSSLLLHVKTDLGGLCLELTRRWVKAQLTAQWEAEETILNWTVPGRTDLKDITKNQEERGTGADLDIEKFERVTSARRTGGIVSEFKGLRTRGDVINHVISTPGVYIYVVSAGSAAHAFAFDTRDKDDIAFFDPNQGEYIFSDETPEDMCAWWGRFWDSSGMDKTDGKLNYKKTFNRGTRHLFKYNVPPTN
jgi:hypothetical protein